jgi:hypothetical protein
MDLTDIYRIFLPTECTFFSEAHGTFFKIGHILCHKVSLNKYKKIEITFCILSYHNAIKLEIDRNYGKYLNTWRLHNSLLNDQ